MIANLLKNKIFTNVVWLLSEKIISVVGLLFVTSYVAKYIGPDNFGKLNISVYYYSIIQTIALWGSDTIGIKRISKSLTSGMNFLFSFVSYRFFVFLIVSSITEFYLYFTFDKLTFYFSLAVCASSLFSVLDVFNSYNEARLKSFFNVIANVIGIFVSLIIRFVIAHFELSPIYLCISIICTGLVPFIIRSIIFLKTHDTVTIKRISFKKDYIKYGIVTGTGLLISSVSVMIYVNISRVLLGYYNTLSDVGIYSVAMTLGTMWGFINNAIVVSITPKLYSANNSNTNETTAFICQILMIIGLCYFMFFYLFGGFIVESLYGESYSAAYSVTFFLISSTCLSGLGMAISRYIISLNGYSYLAKKSFFVVIFGGGAAIFLISHYGLIGASMSACFIELISVSFLNLFFRTDLMIKLFINILNFRKFFDTFYDIFKKRT